MEHWKQGAAEFRAGRYWHAHEQWEIGWKRLPEPEKTYVQGLIQAAGALHLAGLGRTEPARKLACRALEKLPYGLGIRGPKIEAPGLEKALREFLETIEVKPSELGVFLRSFNVEVMVGKV